MGYIYFDQCETVSNDVEDELRAVAPFGAVGIVRTRCERSSDNGVRCIMLVDGEHLLWAPPEVRAMPVLPVPAHEFVFRSPALGMERHVCECGTAEWIARCDECDGLCCEDCGGESVYDSDIGKYRWLCWNCAVGK